MPKITHQHTYISPFTGESITAYVSDWHDGLRFALSFDHEETAESLHWYGLYEGIVQIQSKIEPLIWYMYLSGYWEGTNSIPIKRVMCVVDVNYKHKSKSV